MRFPRLTILLTLLMSAIAAASFAAPPSSPAAPLTPQWVALEAQGSIVTFSGLDRNGIALLLGTAQRLVADPQTGNAVAEIFPDQFQSLAHLRMERSEAGACEALFQAAAEREFPDLKAEASGRPKYLRKVPSARLMAQDSPASRVHRRESATESGGHLEGFNAPPTRMAHDSLPPRLQRRESATGNTCLFEGFEEVPVWYEDGGPWFHYEAGRNNNRGDYFWLDEDCTSATGGWSACAVFGGDYGQYLNCFDSYDYITDSWLKYAYWIDCIAGSGTASLDFAMTLQSELDYDTFGYYVSLDDYNYYGYYYSGDFSTTWYSVAQDLRHFYGLGDLTTHPEFALAFNFYADDQVQEGWGAFVDDIAILNDAVEPSCTLACMASASPVTGPAPLPVHFTASATPSQCTGEVTYTWDFGDGGTSALQNPSHTYNTGGTYTWTVAATVQGVTCTQTGSLTVTVFSRPSLTLASVAGAPGSVVSVPIALANNGATVCGTVNKISYSDTILTFLDAQIGPAAQAAGKDVAFYLNPATKVITIGITGFNQTPIADGVVAYARFTIKAGMSGSTTVTSVCNVADCGGNDLPTNCFDGSVVLATKPGDCNGDGEVSVGEVQKAINMLLGALPVGCGADCNGDGTVSVGEVQKVINVFLGVAVGC
jgi:PKD repeat protein